MPAAKHLPAALQHLTLPVIGSPMFIVSYPELVLAQCKAGIVGAFPALNARPAEVLDDWLTQINAELAAHRAAHPHAVVGPLAVNQIVHASNARLEQDVLPASSTRCRSSSPRCARRSGRSWTPCTATAASCCTT